MSIEHAILTAAFGALTGVLSGLLGVGGGIVMVPYLVLVLGQTQQTAEGTSLLVIVPTAIVGAWTHTRKGFVDWRVAPPLAGGGVLGAVAGAQLALITPEATLTKVFAAFLFLIGLRFVLQSLPRRRVERG